MDVFFGKKKLFSIDNWQSKILLKKYKKKHHNKHMQRPEEKIYFILRWLFCFRKDSL